jgi:periplasmic protein TonB
MMRLASFFMLSLSLHAAALVYPVSFGGRRQDQPIRVTILPLETESLDRGGGESVSPAPEAKSNLQVGTRPGAATSVESPPRSLSTEPQVIAATEIETVSDSGVALISAITPPSDSGVDTTAASPTGVVESPGSRVGGTGGGSHDYGGFGTGFGNRGGAGSRSGSSTIGILLTQARYRDTPRPDYPDSARRDGREGRVLLRVLVDDQGRSKQVEINSSSGSDALDRAAAEAIRRWRFQPARYGDKPVESWLRIPIEFRLADAKSW